MVFIIKIPLFTNHSRLLGLIDEVCTNHYCFEIGNTS
jgi:hypothetical protein